MQREANGLRVVALCIPELPLQRARRLHTDGSGPLAVVAEGRVIHCDAAAAAAGVRPGATVSEALAACGRLRLVALDPAADRAALRAVAEAVLLLAPAVEPCAPDVVLLDASAAASAGVPSRAAPTQERGPALSGRERRAGARAARDRSGGGDGVRGARRDRDRARCGARARTARRVPGARRRGRADPPGAAAGDRARRRRAAARGARARAGDREARSAGSGSRTRARSRSSRQARSRTASGRTASRRRASPAARTTPRSPHTRRRRCRSRRSSSTLPPRAPSRSCSR